MKPLKTRITKKEIERGWKIVRGMVDDAEARPLRTARDRMIALKQIKHLVGMLIRPPALKGAAKGAKRGIEADLAVIADISKFGSLPRAVRGHMLDGRLSRNTMERSHIERIRTLKKHTI
jgi:hypothetical protein